MSNKKELKEEKLTKVTGGSKVVKGYGYICNDCGFAWDAATEKEKNCPECKSENIKRS